MISNASTLQAAYSALLPPTWPVYNLKPDLKTQFSSDNVSTFACGYVNQEGDGGVTHTFANALPANQFQAQIKLVAGTEPAETSTTEVWTFGTVDQYFAVNGDHATVPSTSLTDSLFPPGGPAYPAAWWRSTYNPPSHITCDSASKESNSVQKPPPVISPTAATDDQG